ncbi:MAG: hypothetical protein WCX69_03695 [Candidatus Paceibacterota bacterium]
MENQKQTNNQVISGLRKAVYLITGIILGAVIWFAAGYLIVALTSSIFYLNAVFAIPIIDILIVAVLVWFLPRAANKKIIIIGMLLFFAAVLLVPNPCSLYSFLGAH